MKKVIVSLQGGLGNQMHQYAYGLLLSRMLNYELFFDVHFLHIDSRNLNITQRSFKLNHFVDNLSFHESILSRYFVQKFLKKFRIFRHFLQYLFRIEVIVKHEPLLNLRSGNFKIYYLCGIMGQYIDYFGHEEVLRIRIKPYEFKVSDEMRALNVLNVASVHIRRTDYLRKDSIHCVLDLEYYMSAIIYLRDFLGVEKFYFFSDDKDFVIENFSLDDDMFILVENEGKDADFFDFVFMMNCRFHVVANSTYSWWAAFLGNHCHGNVIAPKKNLKTEMLNVNLAYPEDWVLI